MTVPFSISVSLNDNILKSLRLNFTVPLRLVKLYFYKVHIFVNIDDAQIRAYYLGLLQNDEKFYIIGVKVEKS